MDSYTDAYHSEATEASNSYRCRRTRAIPAPALAARANALQNPPREKERVAQTLGDILTRRGRWWQQPRAHLHPHLARLQRGVARVNRHGALTPDRLQTARNAATAAVAAATAAVAASAAQVA